MEKAVIVQIANHSRTDQTYSSVGRASAAMRRAKLGSRQKYPEGEYAVMTLKEYNEQDTMVTVYNLMSGKPVQLRKSEVGGPCDPSTERYHCM